MATPARTCAPASTSDKQQQKSDLEEGQAKGEKKKEDLAVEETESASVSPKSVTSSSLTPGGATSEMESDWNMESSESTPPLAAKSEEKCRGNVFKVRNFGFAGKKFFKKSSEKR